MNRWTRISILTILLLGMTGILSACGDTWRGVKEDTGQNMEKTGEELEKAGEAAKP